MKWFDVNTIHPDPSLVLIGATKDGEVPLRGHILYDPVEDRYSLSSLDKSVIVYNIISWRFI